jgi:phosphoribosylamine-glycine ligase
MPEGFGLHIPPSERVAHMEKLRSQGSESSGSSDISTPDPAYHRSEKINALVLGNYARGFTYVKALRESTTEYHNEIIGEIHAVGPNAGYPEEVTVAKGLDINDFGAVADYCKQNKINFIIPDSEDQLANGLRNSMARQGIYVAGANETNALLEANKAYARQWMTAVGLDNSDGTLRNNYMPEYEIAHSRADLEAIARKFIKKFGHAFGKVSDLFGGKGARHMTEDNLEDVLDFHDAAAKKLKNYCVVVEEPVGSEEISAFALCTEKGYTLFGNAEDYKYTGTLGEDGYLHGQRGDVTGGMGSNASAAIYNAPGVKEQLEEIISKVQENGYVGTLYVGATVYKDDASKYKVKIIEFNVRDGDPEAATRDPLRNTDIVPHLLAVAGHEDYKDLDLEEILYDENRVAVNFAVATEGYPHTHSKNYNRPINIPDEVKADKDVHLYFGPTAYNDEGEMVNKGSRFLEVVITGNSYEEVMKKAKELQMKEWCEGAMVNITVGQRAIDVQKRLAEEAKAA